jgi:type II secretory pathway component PulM
MRLPDARMIWRRASERPSAFGEGTQALRRLAMAVLPLLLVLCVAVPAQHWLVARREAHRHARALLVQVSQLPASAEVPSPAGADPAEAALMPVVSETASAAGLAFADFRPDGDTRLGLALRDGDFDALLSWIDALDRQHGIVVVSMDLRATSTSGRVDAALVVGRISPGKRR